MLMVTPTSRLLLFHLYATCCLLLSCHVVEGGAASPFSFSFDFSTRSTYRSNDLRFDGDALQHETDAPEAHAEPSPLVTRKETDPPEAPPKRTLLVSAKGAQQKQTSTPGGQQNETSTPGPQQNQTSTPDVQRNQTSTPDVQRNFRSPTAPPPIKQIRIGTGVVIAIVAGIMVIWFIVSLRRWMRIRDSLYFPDLRRFEYRNLSRATGGFSKENALGEGNFGIVYKGRYTGENGNEELAVKKIKQTEEEVQNFIAEVTIVSATRHKNLVRLKGWCCSRSLWSLIDFMWCSHHRVKLFLVYELVPNGTLDDHLHRNKETLPWEKRYQIVMGIGSGLRYLHHECREPVLHRDIKPNNILLDHDFSPKLADFGLSRVASQNNTTVLTTAYGTEGYIDPQCRRHGKVEYSRKSDVYSFGIVLLEIACTDKSRDQVSELYRHKAAGSEVTKAAADGKLRGVFDGTEMERVIILGLKCSHPDGKQRPYMDDAMKFLEDGKELPAITEIEGQQGARFLGTISSDEHAFLPTGLRS